MPNRRRRRPRVQWTDTPTESSHSTNFIQQSASHPFHDANINGCDYVFVVINIFRLHSGSACLNDDSKQQTTNRQAAAAGAWLAKHETQQTSTLSQSVSARQQATAAVHRFSCVQKIGSRAEISSRNWDDAFDAECEDVVVRDDDDRDVDGGGRQHLHACSWNARRNFRTKESGKRQTSRRGYCSDQPTDRPSARPSVRPHRETTLFVDSHFNNFRMQFLLFVGDAE